MSIVYINILLDSMHKAKILEQIGLLTFAQSFELEFKLSIVAISSIYCRIPINAITALVMFIPTLHFT